MNFLPVVSDTQILELAYALYPDSSQYPLNFAKDTDISLGLIETSGVRAILSVYYDFLEYEDTTITLNSISLYLEGEHLFISLEPLQQMNLRFEKSQAVIDDMPLLLPDDTPTYSLIQHLALGRLEHVLTEMDVFHLSINQRAVSRTFGKLLNLRGYHYSQEMYRKFLLMTGTTSVVV